MIAVVRCIILHSIKYGDSGLILKALTPDGVQSFFVASYLKNNRNKYPFLSYPLPIVECQYFTVSGSKLPKVKLLSLAVVPETQGYDFRRQAIATFMAECALKFVREETHSDDMYSILESCILFVQRTPVVSSVYPIQFGFALASQLGFDISGSVNEHDDVVFSLDKGLVSDAPAGILSQTDSMWLQKLISSGLNEPFAEKIPMATQKNIFQAMLQYFRFHFPETGQMRSPEILHMIME